MMNFDPDDEVVLQKDRIERAVSSAKENRRTGFEELAALQEKEAKLYPLPMPSKLEQQYMARARQRQQENIVSQQVVWGREFQGVAFLPKPSTVCFKDFQVGQLYEKKVLLTNISYTFNAFKILPLSHAIQDFFDISYKLMGAMSAGTSCVILVTFQPKLNEDIHDEIPVLAKTGRFSIPLVCTSKKVAVGVTPRNRRLQFGQVVLAESASQTITVTNKGALGTRFDVLGEALQYRLDAPPVATVTLDEDGLESPRAISPRPPSPTAATTPTRIPPPATETAALDIPGARSPLGPDGLEEDRFLLFQPPNLTAGVSLPAHSEIPLTITFNPMRVCAFDTHLILRFADPFTEDVLLFLQGTGVDVPVYVDSGSVLDFKSCYQGTLYRDMVVLRNRGKTSMRLQPIAPPEFHHCLDFIPKVGFIQPNKTLEFQVKFRPTRNLRQLGLPHFDDSTQHVHIPVQVDVADQSMPVGFTVCATLTTSQVTFSPTTLDFGPCSVQEAMRLPVTVTNHSQLPQRLGFVGVPPEISLSPNYGFATLLPSEVHTFYVAFHPTRVGEYNANLRIKTERNEEYVLATRGLGKQPPLKFLEPIVKLANTALGDVNSCNVILVNHSKQKQVFQFELPHKCGVMISPMCGEIAAEESEPVVVEFAATGDLFQPTASPERLAAAAAEAQQQEILARVGSEPKMTGAVQPGTGKGRGAAATGGRGTGRGATKRNKKEEEREREERLKEEQDRQEKEHQALQAALEADEAAIRKLWQASGDSERWSRHRILRVPCYIQGWEHRAVFLEVHVTATLPTLIAELVEEAPPPPPTRSAVVQQTDKGKDAQSDRLRKGKGRKGDSGRRLKEDARDDVSTPGDRSRSPSPVAPVAAVVDYTDPQSLLGHATPLNLIRFGDMPAGKSTTRTILLRYVASRWANIKVPTIFAVLPLDPFGPFAVIKPPEALRPGQVCEVIVQFTPSSEALFVEHLTIQSSLTNKVRIKLAGRGLAPTLLITQDPPHELDTDNTTHLNLGHCLAGETVTKELHFENPCAFDLPFEVRFLPSIVEPWNWDGTLPFMMVPNCGVIPKGESIVVTATFLPDHEFEFFRSSAEVMFGGDKSRKRVEFGGSGWQRGMFVSSPTGIHITETNDILGGTLGGSSNRTSAREREREMQLESPSHSARVGFVLYTDDVPVEDLIFSRTRSEDPFAVLRVTPVEQRYVLEFNVDQPGETASHTIIIGNNKCSDPKRGTAGSGEYTFDGLSELDMKYGWKLDPVRGSVEAGGKRSVSISFTPTALVLSSMPVVGVTILSQVNLRCTVKGGLPPHPDATPALNIFTFLLKGAVRDTNP